MKPQNPVPVQLFVGILYSQKQLLDKALSLLYDEFGETGVKSREYRFNVSDYYVKEMGSPIYRCFYSYKRLIDPGSIALIKIKTNEIEDRIAEGSNRKVNLDPGYLDYDKVVLPSAKYNGNKVYLEKGIWADLTLFYSKGRFTPYPWSFPDFKTGMYEEFFLELRTQYKKAVLNKSN